MASRGNRKRKRGSVEERIDLIHVTLRVANIGNRTAYMRDLKEYLEAMDDLQTLLDSGLDYGMLAAGSIIEDILMHLKGPSVMMRRLCCKTLAQIDWGPKEEEEQHKRCICGSGVIKDLMNILEMCQRQESSSAVLDTKTICVVMNAIACLIDCPGGIKIDDRIPLVHWFFAKSNFEVKTSSLHALRYLCFHNEENAMEISRVAPKIMLSLADMLVCKDEKICHSVLQLIFSLAVSAPALVDHMDFPTDMVLTSVLKIIRKENENLVVLGLCILCTIVIRKGKYKVALAQLGVIPILMQTVQSDNEQIKLYTVGLLHELGKDFHNQVAMVDEDCLPKIFDLFNIQHQGMRKAVRGLLFNFVNNKVVISQFITGGWFETILELKGGTFGYYDDDPSEAAKIIKKLAKNHHHVRGELLNLMRESSQLEKVRIAVALAHFSKVPKHFKLIFRDNGVLQDVPIEPNLQVDNVKKCYEHSRAKSDRRLSAECIIFTIRNFQEVLLRDGLFADEMVGEIRSYLRNLLKRI
ncbi:uncharacterized protein [Medicago truncatula]|uniref:Kinesin-associated protein n=1 Tax=Medicago truncatula TaxID=3880 RepID=G7I6Z1_MEDTR|nr:uncharacterized protein LOC11431776 isoform X2 [Medicago truncatula]AES59002.2 kinesin-associated protein [Medicago truncatula]